MASIDSLEVLKAIAKQVRNATEVGENTAERVGRFLEGVVNWLKDQNFDEKYLRKDIEDTAQQLIHFLNGIDVKGHAVFNDTLSTEKFISGFTSGKGWAIWLKDFINAAGVTEKLACMELDELTVRKTLKVFEFIISQMRGENDNVTFSGFMKVDHYDAETGRIYLKTDDGQLYNPFRVDDYLYCQQFNGMPSEKNDYTVIKTYEFIVTDAQVGSLEDNEKRLDWITLKNFAGDLSLIAENDVLVRLDNLSNPDRKGIIQLMTVGNATPYIDILYGTKTDPDNSLKGRLGNLQGIYHHLFGWLQSFGAYLINLYAVGDFRMRQTGESLDTKIEMTRSLFQTRFQKLSYELTEEDNYLTNATFTENLEGWERENDIDFITMNDEALLLNRSIVTARRQVADIQEYDGQNMLCISNSYIRQLNANIRKPGTHKEYTKVEGGEVSEEFEEVGDTLYLSLKFLCKKSGVLTIGFEGSSVSDDTLPYTTFNVASSVDWQIYKWSGKWDGTGDFVLKFTGDMFVSLLAITDNPLNDYKKEVSTSIEQTHSNIRLLGQNINTLEGTVTNLGIDLDAAEEQISIYADKVNTLEGAVTNLGIRLDAAEGNITIYASKHDSLVGVVTNLGVRLDAAEGNITINAERIDEVDESVTNLGIRLDAAEGNITIYASKADDNAARIEILNGQVSSLSSSIEATDDTVEELAEYVDGAFADGIITETEAIAIEKYINVVENTKADVDATHDKLYGNAYLKGDAKTALKTAKEAFDSAVADLFTAIDSAIVDGVVTPEEKSDVDGKFDAYNSCLGDFKDAVEAAYKSIQDVLKSYSDDNKVSIAELRVDVDSITSTVTTIQGDLTEIEGDVLDAWYEGYVAKGLAEDAQASADAAQASAAVNATAIAQNSDSINLLSASINSNTTSISELRVTTKSISSAVTSVESDLEDVAGGLKDAKDRIEEVADIAESAGDAEVYNQSSNPWGSWPSGSEYKHVGALWYCTSDLTYGGKTYSSGHTYRYIGYDNTNSWEDVTNIQSSASYVVQNKDKISTVVASFDSDGNLTNTSGLVTTSYASSVYATKTTVDELSGRVTTAEASIDVHSTQISLKVSKDGVISAINQSSESITIDASKINLNGYTNVNDTFSVDESGNVIVSGILKGDFEVVYAYQMSHANYTGYWYICNSFSSLHSNNVYLSRNTNQDYAPTTNATTGLPVSCPPSYCHLPATAYGAEFFVYNANNYASVYLNGVTVLSGSNVVKAKSAVRCKCVGYGSTTLGYIFEAVTTS